MKGNAAVLDKLNDLLADELTAINQYMVHAEMCADWRYDRLHERLEKRAVTEMKHAQRLIQRILFLRGTPIVSRLNPLHIGADIPKQLTNDRKAEVDAIEGYNTGIRLCMENGDNGSRELLEAILLDEEAHLDWIEAQSDQMEQMGLPAYLSEQIDD